MAGRRIRGGGGRSARRVERMAISVETAKFIERAIPNLELISEDTLNLIKEINSDYAKILKRKHKKG